jgi:hypothetical protein
MSRKMINIYEPTIVAVEINADKLRQIHHGLFSTKEQLTTTKAEAFLFVHGEELLEGLNGYVREFLKKKLG